MANSVAVVVLGDVGRSPRMQYHCLSLADLPDTNVSFIGYQGEKCVPALEANARIQKYLISAPFAKAPRALFLLWAPLKVLMQVLQLFWTLVFSIPRPRTYLVQNPPSIPVLLVVWLAARLRGASFVIDWHNFGYTVLGLSLGKPHPLVTVSRWYERFFAGRADGHLCVTNAMRQWLQLQWGVHATVLYDKAPPFFKPTPVAVQHDLFMRLADNLPRELSKWSQQRAASAQGKGQPIPQQVVEQTLFTQKTADGAVSLRADRPLLLVSSTSWTEDEDFGLLLDALVQLDGVATAQPERYPDFMVLVTGKGPLRAHYEAKMAALALNRVHMRTLWLAPGDYPLLLGCTDLGVCLHVSTSGLDLPMKVVDLYGAGTPVAAVNFACLSELVKHEVNGVVFDTAEQLAGQLQSLADGWPGQPGAARLAKLKAGVASTQSSRWQDNWTANAAPLFTKA